MGVLKWSVPLLPWHCTQWALTNWYVWFECNRSVPPFFQLQQSPHPFPFEHGPWVWPLKSNATSILAQKKPCNNLRLFGWGGAQRIVFHFQFEDLNQFLCLLSLNLIWPVCFSVCVCVFGCVSFMAAYWFHVPGGPKPNKQKTFYELVIVVVVHAFCVVHKVGFYCFVVAAVFGQLLIGSSKFHCLAFKLQLFAVRMVINIKCCRLPDISSTHCELAWPLRRAQSSELSGGDQ